MSRTSRARSLRTKSGFSEEAVWRVLRAGRTGHEFRRQHPIGPYVADFACTSLRLVIEIDGGIHHLPQVALRDAERQAELERLGWVVLRFPDSIAVARTTDILAEIERHAAEVEGLTAPSDPHPTLRATFSQWEKDQ
jgi:very-short-patch-repair endonuclease